MLQLIESSGEIRMILLPPPEVLILSTGSEVFGSFSDWIISAFREAITVFSIFKIPELFFTEQE